MCGRFTLRTPQYTLPLFGVKPAGLLPQFNIAPSQQVLVIRHNPLTQGRELASLRWGLIPAWAEDPQIGNRHINARAETAAAKPTFRQAFKAGRCLVPADGFYEWRRINRHKQPYFIALKDGRPFAFAGLWERWQRDDRQIDSCAILTTEANELVASLYHRMPVILAPEDFDRWLDPAIQDAAALAHLLCPYPAAEMIAHPVSKLVNSPANNLAECIAPQPEPPPPRPERTLFDEL